MNTKPILQLLFLFLPALAVGQTSDSAHYDRYEGEIAHQPVVMNLHFSSNRVNGSYYYRKVGSIIQLGSAFNEDSHSPSDPHHFSLIERAYGDTSSFSNKLALTMSSDRSLNGTWQSGNGSKSQPVELHVAYPEGSMRLDLFTCSDSLVKHLPAHEQTSATTTNRILVAQDSNSSIGRYVNSRISEYTGCNGNLPEIRNCVIAAAHQYVVEALNEIDTEITELDDSDKTDGWSGRFQYFSDNDFRVLYNNNNILALEQEGSEYSGGAHESYALQTHVLDLATKRELELSDVTSADSTTLDPLLAKYFRIQYNMRPSQPLSDILFEDKLSSGDNFFLSSRGILFIYNPYEVSSWAQGVIQVFVPYSALKGSLAPWLVKRFNL